MHNTRTIIGGDIVAWDNTESLVRHLYITIFAILALKHLVVIFISIFFDKLWRVVV